jgi:hypothetical protein
MRKFLLPTTLAALVGLAGLVAAQTYPNAPAGPNSSSSPTSPPRGGRVITNFGGSGNYLVTSAANTHGSSLWIIDAVQQTVTLCEKVDTAKDFECRLKPLVTSAPVTR